MSRIFVVSQRYMPRQGAVKLNQMFYDYRVLVRQRPQWLPYYEGVKKSRTHQGRGADKVYSHVFLPLGHLVKIDSTCGSSGCANSQFFQ